MLRVPAEPLGSEVVLQPPEMSQVDIVSPAVVVEHRTASSRHPSADVLGVWKLEKCLRAMNSGFMRSLPRSTPVSFGSAFPPSNGPAVTTFAMGTVGALMVSGLVGPAALS